jgi:hypothetical protein
VHGFLTAREFVVASAKMQKLPDPGRRPTARWNWSR